MSGPATEPVDATAPVVVAVDMGYGHLRPAYALAERLRTEVLEADRPPLADAAERRLWARTRSLYGAATRSSQLPLIGGPLRALLAAVTATPSPYPRRDLSRPTLGTRLLQRYVRHGLGAGLIARLHESGAALVTTFYAPAVAAAQAGCERVFCVVTDSDINRVWVPTDPRRHRIRYLVPSHRARRRLATYGVPKADIELTGYPLPHELLGGPELPVLRANLRERIVRLDTRGIFRRELGHDVDHFLGVLPERADRPPLLTFAVGGTGAQTGLVERFLPSVAELVRRERLHVALVAGIRADVRDRLEAAVYASDLGSFVGHGVEVVCEETFAAYVRAFNSLLARTDVLWTKPSEMTFFGSLGLPMVFSWPVGDHERYNRRWAVEQGAGLKQHDPRFAGEWLREWLKDGTLAAAAWSGFMRLPKFGLYRIVEAVGRSEGDEGRAPPTEPASAHTSTGP